jgi:hypothetical protein
MARSTLARLLGGPDAKEKFVYARAARGLLPYRKWSGRVIFLRSEVMEFLSKLEGCTIADALANVSERNGEAQ